MRSLYFVFFSYASKVALRTDWKLEEEEEAAGGARDMVQDEKVMRGKVRVLALYAHPIQYGNLRTTTIYATRPIDTRHVQCSTQLEVQSDGPLPVPLCLPIQLLLGARRSIAAPLHTQQLASGREGQGGNDTIK